MSNARVMVLRRNDPRLNAYVLYTSAVRFIDFDKDTEQEAIRKKAYKDYLVPHFADERLTAWPYERVRANPELEQIAELDLASLEAKQFGWVWFYGGGFTTYTAQVLSIAQGKKLNVRFNCSPTSLFMRVAGRWFLHWR